MFKLAGLATSLIWILSQLQLHFSGKFPYKSLYYDPSCVIEALLVILLLALHHGVRPYCKRPKVLVDAVTYLIFFGFVLFAGLVNAFQPL